MEHTQVRCACVGVMTQCKLTLSVNISNYSGNNMLKLSVPGSYEKPISAPLNQSHTEEMGKFVFHADREMSPHLDVCLLKTLRVAEVSPVQNSLNSYVYIEHVTFLFSYKCVYIYILLRMTWHLNLTSGHYIWVKDLYQYHHFLKDRRLT